jgi:hypothetical protein
MSRFNYQIYDTINNLLGLYKTKYAEVATVFGIEDEDDFTVPLKTPDGAVEWDGESENVPNIAYLASWYGIPERFREYWNQIADLTSDSQEYSLIDRTDNKYTETILNPFPPPIIDAKFYLSSREDNYLIPPIQSLPEEPDWIGFQEDKYYPYATIPQLSGALDYVISSASGTYSLDVVMKHWYQTSLPRRQDELVTNGRGFFNFSLETTNTIMVSGGMPEAPSRPPSFPYAGNSNSFTYEIYSIHDLDHPIADISNNDNLELIWNISLSAGSYLLKISDYRNLYINERYDINDHPSDPMHPNRLGLSSDSRSYMININSATFNFSITTTVPDSVIWVTGDPI